MSPKLQKRLADLVPFGITRTKPHHYWEIAKSRPGARLTDPLFVAEGRNPLTRGRRLSRRGAQLIFKKYQRLGLGREIENLATHIFRKAFALDIAEQYGVATAQEALGYKNLATTQKHIAREVARRRANEFRRGLDLL